MKQLLAFFLLVPSFLAAQPPSDRARRFLDSLRRVQDIPGLSVAVGWKGAVRYAEGFGMADAENQVPVTPSSRFRVGSVSKSITSIALGQLIQSGKLNPEALLHIEGMQAGIQPFTVRQLATHTAGIRHYGPRDGLNCPRHFDRVKDGLVIFLSDSLLFEPGTAFNYSSYGYNLLSYVMEEAAGKPFLTCLQESVFDPLGMRQTCADRVDSVITGRVRFYEHDKQRHLVNAPLVDNSYKWAGGGLLSTPSDLVTMCLGISNILRSDTRQLLFTPQLLKNGKNTGYAYGWRIGKDTGGRAIRHHGGVSEGGRTFLLVYPEHDLVLAVAANMSGVSINLPEMETLASFFLSK